jgi:glycosyltransferase involved in cell wall biosynthesis
MSYPAKLFDYLSVGLPVVANDVGTWTNLIKNSKVGIVTESTPQGFARGISRLLDDPELRNVCGQNALKFIKLRSRSIEKLVKLYESLS